MPLIVGRGIAAVGLVLAGPLILALATAVRLTSPGPAFHRAQRVAPHGTFVLHKLRTMRVGAAASGPGITAAGDDRTTQPCRLLRPNNRGERAHLSGVVRGELALVGPPPAD